MPAVLGCTWVRHFRLSRFLWSLWGLARLTDHLRNFFSAAFIHMQHGKALNTRCALLLAGCRQGAGLCQPLHSHTCSLLHAAQLGVPCWLQGTVVEAARLSHCAHMCCPSQAAQPLEPCCL